MTGPAFPPAGELVRSRGRRPGVEVDADDDRPGGQPAVELLGQPGVGVVLLEPAALKGAGRVVAALGAEPQPGLVQEVTVNATRCP